MLAIAYGCVLIAAVLPYLWVAIAKSSGERYNNRNPRAWQARQEKARSNLANAAHLNAFEAFAPFAAGVILAQLAQVPAERIAALSVAFIVFRVLHGLMYVGNRHGLRSLVWLGGFVCMVALMIMAMLRAGMPAA